MTSPSVLFFPPRAKTFCPSDAGPPHIKLVVEWDDDVKRRLLDDRPWPKPIEHESLRQATAMGNQPDEVTLEECFKLYTSEEQVSHAVDSGTKKNSPRLSLSSSDLTTPGFVRRARNGRRER